MRFAITAILCCIGLSVSGQSQLRGRVVDLAGEPLFAVNVYLSNKLAAGTISNVDGGFVLSNVQEGDTLNASFIGYSKVVQGLTEDDLTEEITLVLERNTSELNEVVIIDRDPISESFSIIKMDKMDIYMNPFSQGDPLRAITLLPSSTTIDESANPSLRGSSADRSRVVLNGVPIYNPVRSSQLNNQGFFSLFNPEIIKNQTVYASNPPLTTGNSSAGLVQIESTNKLTNNQIQISTALSNIGVMLSHDIEGTNSFVQAYSNRQYSDFFIGLNERNLSRLKDFRAQDFGLNFHSKFSEKVNFNTFNYFINESYNYLTSTPSFEGISTGTNKRFFTVNNLKIVLGDGLIMVNNGFSRADGGFTFGNINSQTEVDQHFNSLNYRWTNNSGFNFQIGLNADFYLYEANDSISKNQFNLDDESSRLTRTTDVKNNLVETYLYTSYELSDRLKSSMGFRTNIPNSNQAGFTSFQGSISYTPNTRSILLLSGGKYHSFSVPNFYSPKFILQSSSQIALDYSVETTRNKFSAAVYYKEENNELVNTGIIQLTDVRTTGIEVFYERRMGKFFRGLISNSFIDQSWELADSKARGNLDFNYLLKLSFSYENPKIITLNLAYMTWPGRFYTPVSSAQYLPEIDTFLPIFSTDVNSGQLSNYRRLDVTMSKFFPLANKSIVVFASVNNILNTKNESAPLYDTSYSTLKYDEFQGRTVYFGAVWQFGY